MSTPSEDDGEAALASLWEVSEIKAVMHEVQTRKSVDTLKLFGGPNGTLPSALSSRTTSDVKKLVDRMKRSFDTDVSAHAPKCGVPELLAVLASEAAFCRAQRARRAKDLDRLNGERAERLKLDAARRETLRDLRATGAYVKDEAEERRAFESQKQDHVAAVADAKARVDAERAQRRELEAELDALRQREFDQRRRLDRSRLKVAALRGEMVAPTMDELTPAPLRALPELHVPDERALLDTYLRAYHPADAPSPSPSPPRSPSHPPLMARAMHRAPPPMGATLVDPDPDVTRGELVEPRDAAELRLLRNRVAMHVEEAAEWAQSAAAERTRAALLTRSRTRLEADIPAAAPRAPARARAKRNAAAAAAAASAAAAAAHPPQPRAQPQHVDPPRRKKRRKGVPYRAHPIYTK